MKKFFYFAAAAVMILTAACQREMLESPLQGDTKVTFTVSPAEAATKAGIADGTNVDILYWEIYDENLTTLLGENSVEKTSDKTFTVDLSLVADQNYKIIFWAEVKDKGHYVTDNLRKVGINYTDANGNPLKANKEERAAFFRVYPFSTENGEPINEDVEIYRPFSQLNLGATTLTTSLNKVNGGQIEVESTSVTVTNIANVFNTVSGKGEGEVPVTFAHAKTPVDDYTQKDLEVGGATYHWLGMNYLVVNDESDNVTVDIEVKTSVGTVKHSVPNVPIKANYRTNIIGDILTTGAQFKVIVDEDFYTPDLMQAEGWVHTGNYTYKVTANAPQASLKEILAHADASAKEAATKAEGPEVVINLEGDVYWETGAEIGSTPLLPDDSPISSVVINGNGKTFTATGKGVGKIRLANGSVLTFNDLKIVDKSVSYAEDSWEYGYLEFGGAVSLNDCEVVNAIMLSGETATLTGCSFNSNHDNEYAVWVDNGSASFTGCTFTGARGLKTHEAYGSEVVEITVDGCTFGPLTKKPGMAIGTVNDKTSITIKNSFFIGCQAGDQGLYIYETDTDVTTFTFVEENNEKYSDSKEMVSEMVQEALADGSGVVELPAGEYVVPAAAKGKEITFKGTDNPEDVAVAVTKVGTGGENCDYGLDGSTVTFENITITTNSSTYIGYARCNGTYRNCIINGTYTLYGDSVFENCTFNVSGDVYNIWTWGAPTARFVNCTFNSDGKALLLYGTANTKLTVENCTFNDKGGLSDKKAAIETGNDYNKSYELIVNNTTVNGYEINDKGINTGTTLWANKNSMPQDKLNVVVDGVDVY